MNGETQSKNMAEQIEITNRRNVELRNLLYAVASISAVGTVFEVSGIILEKIGIPAGEVIAKSPQLGETLQLLAGAAVLSIAILSTAYLYIDHVKNKQR